MPQVRAALFWLLAASLVVLEGFALAGYGPPATLSILSVYALFGFASLAAQRAIRPGPSGAGLRPAETASLLILGAFALGAVAAGTVDLRTGARAGLLTAGLVGLGWYLRDAMRASGDGRRAALVELRDASIVPLAVMQVPFFLWATTGLDPVFDARVLAIEGRLGVELTALAHRAFDAVPLADVASLACYFGLPVGLAVAAHVQPTGDRRSRVLAAIVACGIVGFTLYAVSPVVGLFPAYPEGAPPAASVEGVPLTVAAEVPRNGMPSLHTAWALLIAMNAAALRGAWRPALVTFAGLNVWAATGAVGHWALDILVAVPLATSVQAAVVLSSGPRRPMATAGAAACVTLVVAWTAGIRLNLLAGLPGPAAWLAVVATIGLPAAAGLALSASGRR